MVPSLLNVTESLPSGHRNNMPKCWHQTTMKHNPISPTSGMPKEQSHKYTSLFHLIEFHGISSTQKLVPCGCCQSSQPVSLSVNLIHRCSKRNKSLTTKEEHTQLIQGTLLKLLAQVKMDCAIGSHRAPTI